MTLWLDAQLPPALARWINDQELGLAAIPIRDIRLRDASDHEIFFKASLADAMVMTKDRDFIKLLSTLIKAIELLEDGETWVEIRQSDHGN